MDQTAVIRLANKFQHIHRGVYVGEQRVAQIGIEICQARAVNDEIEIVPQPPRDLRSKTQLGLRQVPFDHFDLVSQKARQARSIALIQGIEDRRLLNHPLESFARWIRLLAPDEQVNTPDLGEIQQRIRQPDLADEAGNPDQHHVLASHASAYGKRFDLVVIIKIDDRTLGVMYRSFRRNRSRGERIDAPREVQLAHESLRLPTSVRARARNASK